ncbi:aldo/keto reductase [Nocardia takedensis]
MGFVPFSPLGRGYLTGTLDTTTEFGAGDLRAGLPRFAAANLDANQALVARVREIAEERGAMPGQIALAWLLAQHPWIVPIPGTRRRERLDENTAATRVALSADDIADLDTLAARVGIHGDRYTEAGMAMVGL